MKKNVLKNKLGVAIVPIMIALGVVGAGTVLILNVKKASQKNTAVAKNLTFVEVEKRRISGILSDVQVCSLATNFGGKNPVGTYTKLVTATGDSLIEKFAPPTFTKTYADGMLQIYDIKTIATKGTPKANEYELQITYREMDRTTGTYSIATNNQRSAFIGKKQAFIKIPMFMKVKADGNVGECYAMTENSDVRTVVKQACSPTTLVSSESKVGSILNTKGGIELNCTHTFNFNSGLVSDCAAATNPNTLMRAFLMPDGTVDAANGVDAIQGNSVSMSPNTSPEYCTGLDSSNASTWSTNSTCTGANRVYNVTSSSNVCTFPGNARDSAAGSPSCGSGQMIFRTNNTTTSCGYAQCTSAYGFANEFFVQTLNASGNATCYKAPTTACGANEYAYRYTKDGTPECKLIPFRNTSCPGGSYGSGISYATDPYTLTCASYTITRGCTQNSPTNTTFAYQITHTGVNCTTY